MSADKSFHWEKALGLKSTNLFEEIQRKFATNSSIQSVSNRLKVMEIEDQQCQIISEAYDSSPEDQYFDQVVMCIQETLIRTEFEQQIHGFMEKHWVCCDGPQEDLAKAFEEYQLTFQPYIFNSLKVHFPQLRWEDLMDLVEAQPAKIEEELLDTVLSLKSINMFKELLSDYQNAYQEEERLRILTVKNHKVPEKKKVKGKADNIFGSQNQEIMLENCPDRINCMGSAKKIAQKKEEELLVPDLLLTIKPLRKQ